MTHRLDRRELICGSLALTATAGALTATHSLAAAPKAELQPDNVILFQGDSITDARRGRQDAGANNPRGFGSGYAMLIAAGLLRDYAPLGLKIYNRGISGNKVPDLDARWQSDCIDLQPHVLSILIGVNDIWHKLSGRYDGTVETYQDGLKRLLERTAEALPETRIVICEPFVLRCGAVKENWFPEFDQRRQACGKVAQSLALDFVPFQKMFDDATAQAPPAYWAADGVHPSMAGHALMAKTWREVVGI